MGIFTGQDRVLVLTPTAHSVAMSGDRATAFIVLGSIVVPLAVLAVICWFFWTHRHDD